MVSALGASGLPELRTNQRMQTTLREVGLFAHNVLEHDKLFRVIYALVQVGILSNSKPKK